MEIFYALLALCGELTGPLTKNRDSELWCFLCSAPEQMVDQTTENPWLSLWCHCNGASHDCCQTDWSNLGGYRQLNSVVYDTISTIKLHWVKRCTKLHLLHFKYQYIKCKFGTMWNETNIYIIVIAEGDRFLIVELATKLWLNFQGPFISLRIADFTFLLQNWLFGIT